jgi:hypothetical protein
MFLSETMTMTLLWTSAVAFYMRFLPRYSVRLRLGSCEGTIVEMPGADKTCDARCMTNRNKSRF